MTTIEALRWARDQILILEIGPTGWRCRECKGIGIPVEHEPGCKLAAFRAAVAEAEKKEKVK